MDNQLKETLQNLYIWQNYLPDPVRELLKRFDKSPQREGDIIQLAEDLKSHGYNLNRLSGKIPFDMELNKKSIYRSRTLLLIALFVYTAISVLIAYYSQYYGN